MASKFASSGVSFLVVVKNSENSIKAWATLQLAPCSYMGEYGGNMDGCVYTCVSPRPHDSKLK